MKVLLLADSDSPHIIKWSQSLYCCGIEIGIFSIHKPNKNLYLDYPNIELYSLNISREIQNKTETNLSKLIYLKALRQVKKAIKIFNPNILHAHYASSYGLLGALTKFHPFIISVWGADIYNFPHKSIFHRCIIEYNFRNADRILSTSQAMKLETIKYTKKNVSVTPFGIQIDKFYPKNIDKFFGPENIVIGTVKTLEYKYGIEYLIRAFKILKSELPSVPIKLLIVGRGSLAKSLERLTNDLGLINDTVFAGYIKYAEIERFHNMLDIAIYPSVEDSESFGVAVLESSACEKPVIVSNVGGLPEVTVNGMTGYIVEPKNPEQLAKAIKKLLLDENLRKKMGKNGRKKVIEEFDWNNCVNKMVSEYKDAIGIK